MGRTLIPNVYTKTKSTEVSLTVAQVMVEPIQQGPIVTCKDELEHFTKRHRAQCDQMLE